jgi:hypothetical protein
MTRQRPWPVLTRARPRKSHKLPAVRSPPEVRPRLARGDCPNARLCRQRLDAGGRRLTEGTPLQVSDIDAHRMLVRVPQGTGGHDRCVPRAPRGLALWREDWPRQRPRPWVFPARDGSAPLPPTSLQQTFTAVVRPSGLAQEAASPPLRHSSATPRLERGVPRRGMPARLGPHSPRTTARYTHLTPPSLAVVHATSTALMADLETRRSLGRPEVADVVRRDGAASRERFGAALLPSPRRAMAELRRCRTAALGGPLLPCEPWGQEHDVDHSGRNRRGPKGPRQDTEAWLEARRQALLPVPDCHVVLTRPQALHALVRRNPSDLDDSLLRAAAQALLQLAPAPHSVGGVLGGLGVLHTWPRTRAYHPHGHGLVPAGGVTADQTEWRPARPSSRVPVQALSQRFRGLFLDRMGQERPELTRPQSVRGKGWVVYCQPTMPGPAQVLQSLGRDVHRIALTHSRSLSAEDGHVCFRSQATPDHRWQTRTLPAHECSRRFLPPVLPRGFHKVRSYGLGSPAHRPRLHQLQLWLAGPPPNPPLASSQPARPSTEARCPFRRAGQRCPSGGQGLRRLVRTLPHPPSGPP